MQAAVLEHQHVIGRARQIHRRALQRLTEHPFTRTFALANTRDRCSVDQSWQ